MGAATISSLCICDTNKDTDKNAKNTHTNKCAYYVCKDKLGQLLCHRCLVAASEVKLSEQQQNL